MHAPRSIPRSLEITPRARRTLIIGCAAAMLATVPATAAAAGRSATASTLTRHVLRVGSYNGVAGEYTTIQQAVDAAKPGDWVLIGPGDYKEVSSRAPVGAQGDDIAAASVLITTRNIHVRGMNRNSVMIDGTKPGSPQCSSAEADQTFGAPEGSRFAGNNGIVVYKANGVNLQNFSTCNFLGSNHGGDSVWFDGGGASAKQELGSWWGSYLSSTSTYWGGPEKPSDEYGIYVSNTYGKGSFVRTYANNMSDSGYYIGACPDCNATIDHGHAQNNDLGYSGSNSGGHVTIRNTEFDNNEEGVATQSQNNDDAPSPQDGLCPAGATNPKPPAGVQRTNVCWVMTHSRVVNNNNGATPTSPSAPGLLGTGMSIAGGRHDIVVGNTFEHNNAWGVLLVPYPATETPPENANCNGGVGSGSGETYVCYFDDFANEIAHNKFASNGAYGNPTNGDIGEISNQNTDGNCWHDNELVGGGTPGSYPPAIQTTHGVCGAPNSGEPVASVLGAQTACDSQLVAPCPPAPGEEYPRSSNVKLMPLPAQQSMANPCAGVPSNPWCTGGAAVRVARRRAH